MGNKIINILVHENLIDETDRDIYRYGLFVLLFNGLCIATIILLGCLTDQFIFTLSFLLFYIPFRIFIGGYHCNTPTICYITFNLLFSLILFMNKFLVIIKENYIISVFFGIILLSLFYIIERKKMICVSLICILLAFTIMSMKLFFLQSAFFYAIFTNLFLYLIKVINSFNEIRK